MKNIDSGKLWPVIMDLEVVDADGRSKLMSRLEDLERGCGIYGKVRRENNIVTQ